MKTSPEQRAKLASEAIAHFRKQLSEKGTEAFTKDEIIYSLKRLSCPYAQQLVDKLISVGTLIRSSKGIYCFSTSEPIYYGVLNPILGNISKKQMEYVSKSKSKTYEVESFIPETYVSEKTLRITEYQAIELLKQLGYKIQKPVVSYEDI